MGSLLGIATAFALFTLLPAFLLFKEFGLGVAAAFASISMSLLSIHWEASELNDRLNKREGLNRGAKNEA